MWQRLNFKSYIQMEVSKNHGHLIWTQNNKCLGSLTGGPQQRTMETPKCLQSRVLHYGVLASVLRSSQVGSGSKSQLESMTEGQAERGEREIGSKGAREAARREGGWEEKEKTESPVLNLAHLHNYIKKGPPTRVYSSTGWGRT